MLPEDTWSQLRRVARKLEVDKFTVEIVAAFTAVNVDVLLLKGPTFTEWLYPDEIRTYGDSDLLVSPANWEHASRLLEQWGFRSWVLRPLSVDPGGTDFERDGRVVDLHFTIPGLFGDPHMIWTALWKDAQTRDVAGAQMRVLHPDALLMHVAVHAGHHANFDECKAFEDLRRALARAEARQWQDALLLAETFDGVAAFVTGLNTMEAGRDVARYLGIDGFDTARFALRRENNLIAEELRALFLPGVGPRRKLSIVLREVFPRPAYMRNWTRLARRKHLGLAMAYGWRLLWVASQLPQAVWTLWHLHHLEHRE